MKSVLQTSVAVSSRQHTQKCATSSQRTLSYIAQSVSVRNLIKRENIGVHNSFIQTRTITSDSWAAEGLRSQGEILTSIDHKPRILIDTNYMTGPPPAEVKRICDRILKLNIVEVHILVKHVTGRMGLSEEILFAEYKAQAGPGGGGGGGEAAVEEEAAEPVKEREAFDIKLTVVDPKSKIKIIKEVRALTGLGLKEAKDLVEKAPVIIKEGVKKEDIEAIKKILVDAGATIEII